MPRFYLPFEHSDTQSPLTLDQEATHHAMRVLRLREGDGIEVFNGKGAVVQGTVHFAKDFAQIQPKAVKEDARGLELILLQALVANEKLDFIIEKACELGYKKIVIFRPERCDIKLTNDKIEKRLERWRKIAVSACGQCGLNFLPEILYFPSLKEAAKSAEGLKLLLHTKEPVQGLAGHPTPEQVTIAVGPEGGFTAEEAKACEQDGFCPVKLGSRILRTETAAIVAASLAQARWGDFPTL